MVLTLTRYYRDGLVVKGVLAVDGTPFCETREMDARRGSRWEVPVGRYGCWYVASPLSPMTLKVRLPRGKAALVFGWDLLRERVPGVIALGMAEVGVPPEERRLHSGEATFEAFTRRVYRAYAEREACTLEVREAICE